MGAAYAISVGDAGELPRLMGAAMVYAPAMWVFAGVAALLFGLLPRAMAWTWAGLGLVAFLVVLGPLLDLPRWLYDVSPFEHIPQLPANDMGALPLLVLTAVAAALLAAGSAAFRHRDLA